MIGTLETKHNVSLIVASCALIRPWESILVGATGSTLVILATIMFEKLHVDDPVGALSVHGVGGIWVSSFFFFLFFFFFENPRP